LRIALFGERVFFHHAPMGGRMSEGIATFKNVSMGSLCDPRKQEEILNDLLVEWVKLALELDLENAVRRRFPGHSAGSYGRLARWIDELGFIASDVRFLVERLWRAIVSSPNWRNLPRQWRQRVNIKPAGESPAGASLANAFPNRSKDGSQGCLA
jgi:hypothetical protein